MTNREGAKPAPDPREAFRLAQGFEALAAKLPDAEAAKLTDFEARPPDYEVVIIGSGYGGSIAAAELATRFGNKQQGVCVLERGHEYLRGMFPTCLAELPRHIRYSNTELKPHGERTALLDFRVGPDMSALVANGLGGGSLINAGVMAEPLPDVLTSKAWPEAVRKDGLQKWLKDASTLLGASRGEQPNAWPDEKLPKLIALDRLKSGHSGARAKRPALTVAFEPKTSTGNVQLEACVRCGDCATGCNHGAKESLDTNLLVKAKNNRADIYSGATVLWLEPHANGWTVVVTHTDEKLRRRQEQALRLVARRVVLAAGTFGTTEILLRSRHKGLALSTRLGQRFSGNGDMLAVLSDLDIEARAVAYDCDAPNQRNVGPTITGMIDERGPLNDDASLVIQDLTVPSGLRRLFEEGAAISKTFDSLVHGDSATYKEGDGQRDPCAIDKQSTTHSLTVALIGHDTAEGTLELNGEPADWGSETNTFGDGAVQVRWPQARDDRRLNRRQARLAALQETNFFGAKTLTNPMWRLLPPELEFLFGKQRGPLLTVHPLGGCAMGDNAAVGVVDHLGRVYDPRQPGSTHPGLVVLDGSVVPRSLGINPALTITALSLRAISGLVQDPDWSAPAAPAADPPTKRRIFKLIPLETPAIVDPVPTQVEMIERMSGRVRTAGHADAVYAELTLQFEPQDISLLSSPKADGRRLKTGAGSQLRLFTESVWKVAQELPDDDIPDEKALCIVPIAEGSLTLFTQEPSSACQRRFRAGSPWLHNRGVRDIVQDIQARIAPTLSRWKLRWNGSPHLLPDPGSACGLPEYLADLKHRAKSTWSLLSLAGEVRRFDYDLTLGPPTKHPPVLVAIKAGAKLQAFKRVTYNRRANPWRQLLEAEFIQAPFTAKDVAPAVLELDLRFLERRATPLFRLLEQQDQTTALVDSASFLLYILRVLLRVHTWSFRKPDESTAKQIDRFPRLDGIDSQIFEIDTTGQPLASSNPSLLPNLIGGDARPKAHIRLTRFPPQTGQKDIGLGQPVLMIHGYSVSGTTFAHPAAPSLAKYLCERGYDAWVVDLRTSAAMETARLPWTFEEVAYADIPVAVDHILKQTGFSQVDVVAHCMGSAMVCMALLEKDDPAPYRDHEPVPDPPDIQPLRIALKGRIRRLVMSQVTPVTLFTPNNLFRAFVLRYVRQYLNLKNYSFHIDGPQSLASQLLDRFLTTLPYPMSEFDRENPTLRRVFHRTPWTTTRHRMDALYGRDFSLKNVSDETLEHIDDFFGPLNIETVSQAIHFARFRVLTDRTGFNRYVTLDRLHDQLSMPVLSLHGEENGLVDVATKNYLEDRWKDAGLAPNVVNGGVCDHVTERIEGHGHQDCFIGVDAETAVFPKIVSFLQRKNQDFPCPPPD